MRVRGLLTVGALLGGAAWLLRTPRLRSRVRGAALDVAATAGIGGNESRTPPLFDPEPQAGDPGSTVRSGEAFDDLAEQPASLVEAERDLLTVPGEPGEEHRRRDQLAGHAAQEIAAAQVRARRNGYDDGDE